MKKIRYTLVALFALFLFVGCGNKENTTENILQSKDNYTIGVAVFDSNNTEMRMFINYYKNYIEEGFPVNFIFSDALTSAEDENAFIRSIKEQGADAIISFYGLDLASTMSVCEEEQVYYVLGSGTISDENFQSVSTNKLHKNRTAILGIKHGCSTLSIRYSIVGKEHLLVL